MDNDQTMLPLADLKTCASKQYDFICVGFGPLGAVLSYSMAKQGKKVLVIERDINEPNRIVGELLQPGGCNTLRRLGFGEVLDSASVESQKCFGYKVILGKSVKSVVIPYPNNTNGQSFHHGRFVQGLRKTSIQHPNVDLVHGTVKKVQKDAYGRIIGVLATPSVNSYPNDFDLNIGATMAKEPMQFLAKVTVIADGCFSNLRRELISRKPLVRSSFVGLVLVDADLPAPNHGHVILPPEKTKDHAPTVSSAYSDRGPVLVYQLCKRETRMLIDIPDKLPSGKALREYLETKVAPTLPTSLLPSFWNALNSENPEHRPRSMPNSYLPATPHFRDATSQGAIILGDALNMRHPLTGGGMTVAFNDCEILSQLLGNDAQLKVDLNDWAQVKTALEIWWTRRKGVTACVNTLAQALYSLFGGTDQALAVLREGCFSYFELGGQAIEGPVSLLSALEPSPTLLFLHFFAVAFYSIFLMFWKAPSILSFPVLFFRAICVFYTACFTIGPVLFREIMC